MRRAESPACALHWRLSGDASDRARFAATLMWHHTGLDQTKQSCTLLYDARTGAPQEMRIAQKKTLRRLSIQLAYVSYVPWKTPLSSMRPGESRCVLRVARLPTAPARGAASRPIKEEPRACDFP